MTTADAVLLTAVLNRIVPAGGGFPGAGDSGIGAQVTAAFAHPAEPAGPLEDGLASIEAEAGRRHARPFAGLSADEQDAVLAAVEAARPAFFEALVRHAYARYYAHPAVLDRLGLPARPPQPEGFAMAPFDRDLVERAARRPPCYRPA